jgi:uncharacterized membrane protein
MLDPRRAGARLSGAALIGVVAWWLAPAGWSAVTRVMLGGDAAGLALLAFAGWLVVTADADETRRRAAAHDPGRLVVWLLVLVVSTTSLFATTFILRHAKSLPTGEGHLLSLLGVAAGALAWLLTHTAFTLRYAHLYYRGGADEEGGIEFPGGEPPDDLDFAYFAFTLGMCFQVSDTQVTDRLIRRTVTAHVLLSFAFNTGILALVVNLAMSQVG